MQFVLVNKLWLNIPEIKYNLFEIDCQYLKEQWNKDLMQLKKLHQLQQHYYLMP
jgi:hypothetical protein